MSSFHPYLEPMQRFENRPIVRIGRSIGASKTARARASGCVEGDLTASEEVFVHGITVVKSAVNKRRAIGANRISKTGSFLGDGRNMHEKQKKPDQRKKDENRNETTRLYEQRQYGGTE